MMKKNTISILSVGLALLLVFSPFTSSHVEASDLRKCDMTITSDNTWGKFARPSGDCNEFFKGYYVPESKRFVVSGSWTGEVTNGQKIRTHLPVGDDYPEYELTVKTVVKQPKPEPEPEEPEPEEPKPEPKEPEKEKPKETKPKQPKEDNSKDSSSGDNKSSNDSSSSNKSNNNSSSSNSGSNSSGNKGSNTNNSGTSNSGSNSSGTNSTSSNNKGSSSNNSSNNNENVVEGDKELPDAKKEWTIEEMKDKNAKVIDEDGKYFVEIDGVKREITEEQAEELGHEKESDEDDEEKEVEENSEKENEKEAVEEEPSKDQDNDKGNKTKTTVIAVGTTGALAGTIGGIYYFHPSGREAIDKILKKILNLFKFGK